MHEGSVHSESNAEFGDLVLHTCEAGRRPQSKLGLHRSCRDSCSRRMPHDSLMRDDCANSSSVDASSSSPRLIDRATGKPRGIDVPELTIRNWYLNEGSDRLRHAPPDIADIPIRLPLPTSCRVCSASFGIPSRSRRLVWEKKLMPGRRPAQEVPAGDAVWRSIVTRQWNINI
jgi:hypothetical protein